MACQPLRPIAINKFEDFVIRITSGLVEINSCIFLIGLTLTFISGMAQAQNDSTKKAERNVRISPLPVVLSTPETKLGFGALVAINFETDKIRNGITRTSYTQNYAIYTINRQFILGDLTRIYSPQNKFIIYNALNYTYFPEYYYGIATESPLQHTDTISYRRIMSDIRVYRKVKSNFYLGIASRFHSIKNVDAGAGNFVTDKPIGYAGYWIQGFAPALAYETRDNYVYPRKGFYLESMYYIYPSWGGSSYSFQQWKVDVRKYFPLQLISPLDAVALQFFASVSSGDVPFKDMADLGGNIIMRGYYLGYYRFKNLLALQAEYRTMVTKRIGFTTWLGGALTPRSLDQIFESAFVPNAGIGLRIMINTKDRLNIRLDQGFGKDGQRGFYTDMAEAY